MIKKAKFKFLFVLTVLLVVVLTSCVQRPFGEGYIEGDIQINRSIQMLGVNEYIMDFEIDKNVSRIEYKTDNNINPIVKEGIIRVDNESKKLIVTAFDEVGRVLQVKEIILNDTRTRSSDTSGIYITEDEEDIWIYYPVDYIVTMTFKQRSELIDQADILKTLVALAGDVYDWDEYIAAATEGRDPILSEFSIPENFVSIRDLHETNVISTFADSSYIDQVLSEEPDHPVANLVKSLYEIMEYDFEGLTESIMTYIMGYYQDMSSVNKFAQFALSENQEDFFEDNLIEIYFGIMDIFQEKELIELTTSLSERLSYASEDLTVQLTWEAFLEMVGRIDEETVSLFDEMDEEFLPEGGYRFDYRDFLILRSFSDTINFMFDFQGTISEILLKISEIVLIDFDDFEDFKNFIFNEDFLTIFEDDLLPLLMDSDFMIQFLDELYDIENGNVNMDILKDVFDDIAEIDGENEWLSAKDIMNDFELPALNLLLDYATKIITNAVEIYEFEKSDIFIEKEYINFVESIVWINMYLIFDDFEAYNINEDFFPDKMMLDETFQMTVKFFDMEIDLEGIESILVNGIKPDKPINVLNALLLSLPDEDISVTFDLPKFEMPLPEVSGFEKIKIREGIEEEEELFDEAKVEIIINLEEFYNGFDLTNLNTKIATEYFHKMQVFNHEFYKSMDEEDYNVEDFINAIDGVLTQFYFVNLDNMTYTEEYDEEFDYTYYDIRGDLSLNIGFEPGITMNVEYINCNVDFMVIMPLHMLHLERFLMAFLEPEVF